MAQISRIILKMGTGLIVNEDHNFNLELMKSISHQVSELKKSNIEIVIVSSGAIGLAKSKLKYEDKNLSLAQKQALAALGQPLLMSQYIELFNTYDLRVAQVLLTTNDLSQRESYLNLKQTFDELLKQNIIPIINENDCVSTNEIYENREKSFGDNDVLSALVASKLDADLLVILTDVAGIFNKNPQTHTDASLIAEIKDFNEFPKIDKSMTSKQGRGGMTTKIKAAKTASLCGVSTLIASGYEKNILLKLMMNEMPTGTWIHPQGHLQKRKKWLGFSKSISGFVVVNEGAQLALENKHASLLPIGVTEIKGNFNAGDLICIITPDQIEVGRGLSNYSSLDLKKVMGLNKMDIKKINKDFSEELIHRDSLVVFKELYK